MLKGFKTELRVTQKHIIRIHQILTYKIFSFINST